MDDNMVGGSATTIESQGSSLASHSKSSPQSANSSLQSPMLLNHQVPQQQPQQQQQHNHHTTSHHHPYHHHPYHIQDSQAGLIDATSSAHYSLKMATTSGFMSRSNKHQILHKAASHDMFSGFPTHQQQQQQHGTYGSYGSNNSTTGSGYPLQSFYGTSPAATATSTGSGSFSLAQQAQVRSMQNAQGLLSHNSHLLNHSTHHSSTVGNAGGGGGGGSEIDYFTTLVLPAVGDISVSSGNSGASGASYGNGAEMPNYLTRQQPFAPRRHSTQLSNLSM